MAAALAGALPGLEPIDQLGLLRDSFALAEAGYQTVAPALEMLAALPADANPVVASGAVARWASVHGYAEEQDKAAVAALAAERLLPRLRRLGFDPKDEESLADTALRADLVVALGIPGVHLHSAEVVECMGPRTTGTGFGRFEGFVDIQPCLRFITVKHCELGQGGIGLGQRLSSGQFEHRGRLGGEIDRLSPITIDPVDPTCHEQSVAQRLVVAQSSPQLDRTLRNRHR
jgi:hypothetical protein